MRFRVKIVSFLFYFYKSSGLFNILYNLSYLIFYITLQLK